MHIHENRCQSVSIIGLDYQDTKCFMYVIACLMFRAIVCFYTEFRLMSINVLLYWSVLEYFNTLVTLHTNILV